MSDEEMELEICPGCNAEFTYDGIQRHSESSRNPRCRWIFNHISAGSQSPPSTSGSQSHESSRSQEEDVQMDASHDGPDVGPQREFNNEHRDLVEDGDLEDEYEDEGEDEDPPEQGWEPRLSVPRPSSRSTSPDPEPSVDSSRDTRARVERAIRSNIYVVPYPSEMAGRPLPKRKKSRNTNETYGELLHDPENDSEYAPFRHRIDWEIARWAKLRGPGSNAFSELVKIPGVSDTPLFVYKSNNMNVNQGQRETWAFVSQYCTAQQDHR